MFALEVELLTGRYVATAYNDRSRAEWPPHPARLFSALVAAHHAADPPPPDESAALEWLQRQGPPVIGATEAAERETVTVFVPVNDAGVVGDFEKETAAIATLRADLDRARREGALREVVRLEKRLAAELQKLDAAMRRAVAEVGRKAPSEALEVLPEGRVRQPRTFPSVCPREPRVVFAWADAEPTPAQRAALDAVAARVVRLGHSSSLVSVRLSEGPAPAGWRPDEGGELRLRIPRGDQLERLGESFERHRETQPRVMPATFQPYTTRDATSAAPAPRPVLGDDWLVLRRVGGPRLPSVAGPAVARSVRAALMKFACQPVPEVISGHRADGSVSDRPHLAFLPLPNVGGPHADGGLLGLALAVPRAASPDERRAVLEAVERWEATCPGDDPDAPVLPVFLGRAGAWELTRLQDEARQSTLRATTWCRPARRWASATPVALDRNPGDLRSDGEKRARAYAEAEEAIAAACEHVGLPRPRVTVLPAAPLVGAEKARAFAPFPGGGRPPRVLTHARLVFPEPVAGPVILGAGRYVGMGLFRPIAEDR